MDTKDLLNDSSIHHGRNLVRLMNRKGLKVEDLEKALQLSQKQVEELMEMKKIDDEMLDKLAKALDVSVETIKEMRLRSILKITHSILKMKITPTALYIII